MIAPGPWKPRKACGSLVPTGCMLAQLYRAWLLFLKEGGTWCQSCVLIRKWIKELDFFEQCYYVNPSFLNMLRIGNFLILRYACGWKIVTLEGRCFHMAGLVREGQTP